MRALRSAALALLAATLAVACATPGTDRPRSTGSTGDAAPTAQLLLVSFDGFRWDFTERTETPHFDRLAASGVRAERLIPSFPTKTYPNHYTLITGLYPGHHGVVANNMWDPELGALFSLDRRDEVRDRRWYGGEPIWVTAARHGLASRPYFWPGSQAGLGGFEARIEDRYDGSVPNRARIDTVLDSLAGDAPARPAFATLYFSLLDDIAHRYDPERAPEVEAAIREADALLGHLLDGLASRGLDRVNVILVSDHGMAANSPERVIRLDDYVDLGRANVVDWNPVAALWPEPGDIAAVYGALAGAHPHLSVYRRDEIPERFHYRSHRRIPPILAVADEGWVITSSRELELDPDSLPHGSHGYDNRLISMGALFLAAGPAFRSGVVSPPFKNVHVYELMCRILELQPAPNDGDLEAVRHLLADAER